MKSEKMYDAISGISDDIIESAGEYRFERKKRSLAWLGYAAAACLVLSAAAFGVSRLAKAPGNTQEAAVPTQEAAIPTQEVTQAPEPEKTVLYGDGQTGAYDDESWPNPGTTNISYPLANEILKAENADCLFAVSIGLTHVYDDIWDELNKQWHDAIQDPDCVKYIEMYWEWEEEKFRDMLPDEIAAYYGMTYEEFDNRPEHPTKGNIAMNEDFKEYLKEQVDPMEYGRLVEAHERLDAIDDEMWGSRTRINAAVSAAEAAECERLNALGYDMKIEDGLLIGYLSGEQIAHFACSDTYGYIIHWIGADNIMDE